MKTKLVFACLVFLLVFGPGCSDNSEPSRPVVFYDGKMSIRNQSGVNIRLMEYTQTRGTRQYSYVMNRLLSSGFQINLPNMLDGGQTDIFPGGDIVVVRYISLEYNPGDPTMPGFDNTIGHTINGYTIYYIKSGGSYSLSP